jgi:hypothetical protein
MRIEIHREDLAADWKLAVAGDTVFKNMGHKKIPTTQIQPTPMKEIAKFAGKILTGIFYLSFAFSFAEFLDYKQEKARVFETKELSI